MVGWRLLKVAPILLGLQIYTQTGTNILVCLAGNFLRNRVGARNERRVLAIENGTVFAGVLATVR